MFSPTLLFFFLAFFPLHSLFFLLFSYSSYLSNLCVTQEFKQLLSLAFVNT